MSKVEKIDSKFYLTDGKDSYSCQMDFGDAVDELRRQGLNVDAMVDAPRRAARDVLKRKGIPECFGSLHPFYPYSPPFEFLPLPDAETIDDAFTAVMDDLVEKEKNRAIQYAHCVYCPIFDRCKAISPSLGRCDA